MTKYFVAILVDTIAELLPKTDKKIGIDLGLGDMIVDSNGHKVLNPKTLYKYELKLAKEQRKLSKSSSKHDRDINAAINILRQGLIELQTVPL